MTKQREKITGEQIIQIIRNTREIEIANAELTRDMIGSEEAKIYEYAERLLGAIADVCEGKGNENVCVAIRTSYLPELQSEGG